MNDLQAEKTCSNCGNKFIVSWWSERSHAEAMKIETCLVCEIELHPNGILAQMITHYHAAALHIDNGEGKPLCGGAGRNAFSSKPAVFCG